MTAEGEAFPSDPARLRYADVSAPAPGESTPIAPSVRWARIPLPLELSHINVWLISTPDGCVVVDTGVAAPMGMDAWERIAAEFFATQPLAAIFVTHIHPDHIGLAAWLQERHGVPVWMSARTRELAVGAMRGDPNVFPIAESFLRRNGLDDFAELLAIFKPERFIRMTSGLPKVERCVSDGESLPASGDWIALETNGHAEGHLCLWNERERVLVSGDQVLPTISSNVSYNFRSGDPNPLDSYLSSLARLRTLPADTLVLPSHGAPFYGLHQRIDDLTRRHREQLELVAKLCERPMTAAELLPHLFPREPKGFHRFLALGEALAHLEYLVHDGRLERTTQDDVVRYVRRSRAGAGERRL